MTIMNWQKISRCWVNRFLFVMNGLVKLLKQPKLIKNFHDPRDASPPLLLMFYTAILLIVSFSLILIIHNAFAVSMNARIHQVGILASIGATPGQIRLCLLQEAAALCMSLSSNQDSFCGSVFSLKTTFPAACRLLVSDMAA